MTHDRVEIAQGDPSGFEGLADDDVDEFDVLGARRSSGTMPPKRAWRVNLGRDDVGEDLAAVRELRSTMSRRNWFRRRALSLDVREPLPGLAQERGGSRRSTCRQPT